MTQTLWIQTRRKGTAGKAPGHVWTDGRGALSRIHWIFVGSSEAVVSLLGSFVQRVMVSGASPREFGENEL